MTKEGMGGSGKSTDMDLFRRMVRAMTEALISIEVDNVCGAPYSDARLIKLISLADAVLIDGVPYADTVG